MPPIPHDVPKTKGAVLIGGLAATMLTGFVYIQAIVYFKVYASDMWQMKALVVTVWLLDTVHTVFIWLALWSYFILNFGHEQGVDAVNWELGLVIIFTGLITYLVHLFHSHRLFQLTRRNYLLAVPIVFLASVRLIFGVLNGAQMLHYETISRYRRDTGWIFTTGLVLSALVDVLLTISLIAVLYSKGRGTPTMNAVVGSVMKYAFETACVTSAGSLTCVFCWMLMTRNLVFLAVYFVIAKFYANSLLSTLIMRKYIRRTSLKTPPYTPVDRMQFRPGRIAGDTSLSTEESQLGDGQALNEVRHIAGASSCESCHVTDMDHAEARRRHAPSRFKPPCVRSPDPAHPKGKTIVEVKVTKSVADR